MPPGASKANVMKTPLHVANYAGVPRTNQAIKIAEITLPPCLGTDRTGTEMPQLLNSLKESPFQTAGSCVHIGLSPGAAGYSIFGHEMGRDSARPEAPGERIRVEGVALDGTGAPLLGLIEQVHRRETLMPRKVVPGQDRPDIRLRGKSETVCLNV